MIAFYSTTLYIFQKQVAAIMKISSKSFELEHVDVQQQIGTSDCALFAMAFAMTLCHPHTNLCVF